MECLGACVNFFTARQHSLLRRALY